MTPPLNQNQAAVCEPGAGQARGKGAGKLVKLGRPLNKRSFSVPLSQKVLMKVLVEVMWWRLGKCLQREE